MYQLTNGYIVLERQGSSPLSNSAAGSLPTPRDSAAGRYAQILANRLIDQRFLTFRPRFSGTKWSFSLLSGTWLGALLLAIVISGAAHAQSVLTYHGSPDRSGHYVVPGLSWERARSIRLDPGFRPKIAGHLYAQPLYWRPPGSASGQLVVATEDDNVYIIDARSGREIWARSLGKPVALSTQPCGNIDPLGITGTPVIDEATQAIYLAAMIGDVAGPHHRVFALSLKDGAPLPGWPVDIATALAAQGQRFATRYQNQRGALANLDGRVYVPYGGHYGDCGDYRGWVVGIRLRDPRDVVSWSTRGRGGGIWAPGGIASDGRSLFVATGNTMDVTTWRDGEAVLRLAPDLHRDDSPQSYFAPSDWRTLDDRDADLGGTNPLPLDVPGAGGTSAALLLALGKDDRAYLLDRDRLGGIGGSLISETVATRPILGAPAAYRTGDGVYVAFQGQGEHCPPTSRDRGLTVLQVRAGSPPSLTTAWCGALRGQGSPIVTTTDGRSNPIVWVLGAEGDDRLHAFRGDNGEALFAGGGPDDGMTGLRHFQTLLAADDRLYVGADGRLYAFAF
jgi:outer membrane protein assembly factor BamB